MESRDTVAAARDDPAALIVMWTDAGGAARNLSQKTFRSTKPGTARQRSVRRRADGARASGVDGSITGRSNLEHDSFRTVDAAGSQFGSGVRRRFSR